MHRAKGVISCLDYQIPNGLFVTTVVRIFTNMFSNTQVRAVRNIVAGTVVGPER